MKNSLINIYETLNHIAVKGKDDITRILVCLNTLEQLIATLEQEATAVVEDK